MISAVAVKLEVVALRDGSTVSIRQTGPDDEPLLLAFFESLSEESRASRFFSAAADLSAAAHAASVLRPDQGVGLAACASSDGRIVGHASYRSGRHGAAEVDFAVAEQFQGRGIATLLLGRLADIASARGIRTFKAHVMTSNGRMLDVFRNSGFLIEVASGNGVVHLTFPTQLTEEALERFEQREQIAACSALAAFLKPSSIAVIGASRRRGTPGGEVFHNLLAGEFRGPVYPINPAAEFVQSVAAYRSIGDVPRMVDLAVIAVPADQVLEVAQECAEKRIHSLLVLSAGFAEIGGQGRERQQELLSFCRQNGMRLIGPNCIGVTNTSPAVRLDATFGPLAPPRGRVGFMSQSGALGIAAMAYAAQRGLGISSFVSVGNKADISGNDLLKYWESDPDTDVIVLYLESFGNPRKFARIAQRVGKQKPIVVVKSGRSPAGARATSSHTGAMVASSDVTVDALFRQVGVIRTDTLEELFDAVTLLANQPLPAGRRVALITNAGGPAILCADACVASGLDVPQLSLETQARLQEFLPAFASVTNPVDMIATATAEDYARTLAAVAADPNIDSIIVLFIQPLATRSEDVAKVILDAARMLERHKPVLAALMSLGGSVPSLTAADVAIPTYAFPESAAVALGHAARYAEWARRPTPLPFHPADIRVGEALALVARARDRGADWLDPKEAADLLACYGLPLIEQRLAGSAEDAGQIAVDLGGPIALKGMAPGIVHKTEAGLVRLNLEGRDAVAQAARDILSAIDIGDRPAVQLLIQRMAAPGVEMLVGVVNDPQFGPLIACGAGGVLVELLKDVSLGLTPLMPEDASRMLHELKTYPLLQGYRGGPICDINALEDVLLRVSAMAETLPQLAEMDLNPVVVASNGAVILDARVRVQP